jgi:hypothetical protein
VVGGQFGNSEGGAEAGADAGATADSALGLFANWQDDAMALGLKVAAAAACVALLVVGAKQTITDKD